MTPLDLWVVAAYLAASLAVGVALARRASGSIEDFFVGGRALPWWLAGTSMAATTFSIDTPLYVAGVVGTRGIAGNWEWWSFGVAHVVLLYVFARLWRRAEVVTDNELSELRYGGRPAALLRGVKGFLFAGILGPISLGLSMLAMVKVVGALDVLSAMGLSGAQDRLWVVTGVSALVLVYAGISGLWGVVVTDFVQFVLGMAGALLVAWAAVSHLGGLDDLVAAAGAVERVDLLAFTPLTWGDGGRIVWSAAAGISASTFFAYVGLQWWAFRRSDGGGEFVQRLAAARTEADAQKAAWLFNLLHYVVRTWPWIIVALAAVVLYPDLADPELGYPRLMLDFLPAGVLGLVVASLVAAFMSTVSTTINWSASYLTHDLYARFVRPHASSRERVIAARVASVVVTALGAAAAFYSENVTTLFRLIIAVGTGPGLVLILRWFWWRINAWAELSAMVAGFLVGLGTSVVPVFQISDFGLRLLVTALATTAVWVPVMLLTPAETPERLELFYRKVRPGGPGWSVQRRRTGVEPDGSLASDLERVAAGLLILFGAMFAVGGLVLLRFGVAIAAVATVVAGTLLLRRANRRRIAAGMGMGALVALSLALGSGGVAAQVVDLAPGEGAGRPLTDWLAGRFPALQVLSSSGTPGSAPRLRVRGPHSLALSNEPLVILDGIRIASGARSASIDVGGQAPSRLDDVPVTSLARVELVRGPAAARFGVGATGGVLVLTSRAAQGSAGSPTSRPTRSLNAWTAAGRTSDVAPRPANWFGREGTGACFAWEVSLGRCEQTELQVYAPFDARVSTPFRARWHQSVGARATERVGTADLAMGVSWDADRGVLGVPAFDDTPVQAPDGTRRTALDLGVAMRPTQELGVRLYGAWLHRTLDRVVDGNDFAGLHATGLLGFAEGGPSADYGYRLFRPSQVYARDVDQRVSRFTGGVALSLDLGPGRMLSVEGGIDRVVRDDLQEVAPGVVVLGTELPRGVADDDRTTITAPSARLALSIDWRPHERVEATTELSADLWASSVNRLDRHGVGLPDGGGSVDQADDLTVTTLEGSRRATGVALRQQLEIGGALTLDAGARFEANRALGRTLDAALLPWVEARVRGGGWWLGAGGARTASAVRHDGRGLDRVGLAPDAPDPPLEYTTTWQVGIGGETAAGRLAADLVGYVSAAGGLLLRTPLLYSQAADGARYDPVVDLRNRGLELSLRAHLIDRAADLQWSVEAAGALLDNEVTALRTLPGADAPPQIRQGVQWSVPGYPLAGYWDRPFQFEDRDGDGILVPSEVGVEPDATYLGSPHPGRELTLASRLSSGPFALTARVMHRGGHKLRNLTEGYRCQVTLCRGFNDPRAPLSEQARALIAAVFPPDFVTEAGFIEDASFWRLREAGLSWTLPQAWTGSASARLTVSGHNLATWTGYTGMDPEVDQFGATEVLVRDFMTQPPVRRWSVRLDVGTAGW